MTIAVDTNVIIRYLVWDDPGQAQAAADLIESGEAIWISTVVLCETAWVLKRRFRRTDKEIAHALGGVTAPQHVAVEDEEALRAGLSALERGGDFADGCILGLAKRAKVDVLVTFDRRLAKVGGASVRLLGSA